MVHLFAGVRRLFWLPNETYLKPQRLRAARYGASRLRTECRSNPHIACACTGLAGRAPRRLDAGRGQVRTMRCSSSAVYIAIHVLSSLQQYTRCHWKTLVLWGCVFVPHIAVALCMLAKAGWGCRAFPCAGKEHWFRDGHNLW